MNVYDLKDRVAIVTGGAQGIGLAVANRILASGGKVSIWDRDRPLLDKTVAALAAGDRVQGLSVDIADLAAVEAATKQTLGQFGKIDILINNAAVVGPNAQHLGISARSISRRRQCRPDRHVLLLPHGGAAHDRCELRPHR